MPVDFPPPPPSVPPPGTFSHIAIASGELVALAGQTGRAPDGSFAPDIVGQAEQAFATIGALLEAAGTTWANVVSFRTYVVGADNIATYRPAREALFQQLFPSGTYPTNTLLVVTALGRPEALIEIETLAVR